MHIKLAFAAFFKRFTRLLIDDIPPGTKLVVMVGPNGSGKSSVFDAFTIFYHLIRRTDNTNPDYHLKRGFDWSSLNQSVQVQFHEMTSHDGPKYSLPSNYQLSPDVASTLFYFRTAFRDSQDAIIGSISAPRALTSLSQVSRMDIRKSTTTENYEWLMSQMGNHVIALDQPNRTIQAIHDQYIEPLKQLVSSVFDNLELVKLSPLDGERGSGSTFLFKKGNGVEYPYRLLSSGEKSAFDLLFDIYVKSFEYKNTIYCIDEPEVHINAKLHGRLLRAIYNIIPDQSQLWIATHSVGMLREALKLRRQSPEAVAFLDFSEPDFDQEEQITLKPAVPTRDFWLKHVGTYVGDLSELVAPDQIIFCEGSIEYESRSNMAGFDAKCYNAIFGSTHPGVLFVSVGSANEVLENSIPIEKVLRYVIGNISVTRLIDSDNRTPNENSDLIRHHASSRLRILTRRHLESYLFDDEVLVALCESQNQPELIVSVLEAKSTALETAVARGKLDDDIKAAASELYQKIVRLLRLRRSGGRYETFALEYLVPLITSKTGIYKELEKDIFG